MLWVRHGFVVLTIAALGQPLRPQSPDQNFPDELLSTKGQAAIRWNLRVSPVRLGESQRLQTSIRAEIGDDESAGRRLSFFVEIRDRGNRMYRSRVFAGRGRSSHLSWIQPVCIVPGEYKLAAVVYDTQSKEHSVKQANLRVPELRHDPLPGLWHDLPKVEYSRCDSAPLSLPLQTWKPIRLEIVLNESMNRNQMGSLIPRLEVISTLAIRNGSMGVTMLDLERRRVSFSQELATKLDRRGVRAAVRENEPLKIDAQSLSDYKDNAQFFVSEIRRRLEKRGPEAEHVLIVMSAPRTFPQGEDLTRIQATPQPGGHIFYIRCRPVFYAFQLASMGFSVHPRALRSDPNADSLEQTLKPLNPRLFDVTTPAQFRRALGTIMSEISQL